MIIYAFWGLIGFWYFQVFSIDWARSCCRKLDICFLFPAHDTNVLHSPPVPAPGGKTTTIATTPNPGGAGACPRNFFQQNSACFMINNQKKSWQDARTSCQFFNADLASTLDVFDVARLDFELYNHNIISDAWIGMRFDVVRF